MKDPKFLELLDKDAIIFSNHVRVRMFERMDK